MVILLGMSDTSQQPDPTLPNEDDSLKGESSLPQSGVSPDAHSEDADIEEGAAQSETDAEGIVTSDAAENGVVPQHHGPAWSQGLQRNPGLSTPGSGFSQGGLRRPVIKPILVRPRKVRGGVKLPNGDVAPPTAWVAQRWLRLIEQAAEGARLVEGLEDYARAGQTKKISYMVSRVDAIIQGRADRPYATSIAFDGFTPETWDKVVETMAEGALYAAKLLASELPPNIEDVFAPLGLKLFPVDSAEVKHSCSCLEWRNENGGNPTILSKGKWCKHICCLAYLLAQKLSSEPFLVFMLRGIEGSELLERLRQRRAVAGAVMGHTPIYSQRIPGAADFEPAPLEESLDQFWDAGPALGDLDLPITLPPVSHPLLRRLGQSPFVAAQFPLVGLLASCYDTVSEQTLKEQVIPALDDPDSEESELDEDDSSGENVHNQSGTATRAATSSAVPPASATPMRATAKAMPVPAKAMPLAAKATAMPLKAQPAQPIKAQPLSKPETPKQEAANPAEKAVAKTEKQAPRKSSTGKGKYGR